MENIWEVERCHNSSAEWLHKLQGKHNELQTQEDLSILQEDATNCVQQMANWKAPGLDQVQVYWFKNLTSLHARIAEQFQVMLDQPQ